jgi:hypothetical protein
MIDACLEQTKLHKLELIRSIIPQFPFFASSSAFFGTLTILGTVTAFK